MKRLVASALAAALLLTLGPPPAIASDRAQGVLPVGTGTAASPLTPTCYVGEPLARTLINAQGYFGIKNMTQDIGGMWRGTAVRYGYVETVRFELDGDGRFAVVGK
jgi:hypothetical protein